MIRALEALGIAVGAVWVVIAAAICFALLEHVVRARRIRRRDARVRDVDLTGARRS